MEEIWKEIEGYEGIYFISNHGNVKSMPRKGAKGGIIKATPDKDGYWCIGLNKHGHRKTFKVHRLVAIAFIPNDNNLPEVNHKDEDKTNNHVDNLEWCEHVYNSRYGSRPQRISSALSTPVYSIDENGNVEHFASMNIAYKMTGVHVSNIASAVNGIYSQAGNRKWYYDELQIANND